LTKAFSTNKERNDVSFLLGETFVTDITSHPDLISRTGAIEGTAENP